MPRYEVDIARDQALEVMEKAAKANIRADVQQAHGPGGGNALILFSSDIQAMLDDFVVSECDVPIHELSLYAA